MSGIGNLPSDYKQTEMEAFRKSGANFNEYFDTKGSGYEPVKSKSSADSFLGKFKSNMSDYFDDNPNAFDFTGKSDPGDISIGKKVDAFTAQIFPNFVKDYGPQKEAIGIGGTPGTPGFFSQIAGPVAGAAASALFACDLNLKHDIDYLTDMNLVRDDLADVAYFVKELQDS